MFGGSELFSYADAGAHRFQKRLLVSHVRGRSLNPNSLPEIVIMPDQISLLPSTPHRVKVKKKIKKKKSLEQFFLIILGSFPSFCYM